MVNPMLYREPTAALPSARAPRRAWIHNLPGAPITGRLPFSKFLSLGPRRARSAADGGSRVGERLSRLREEPPVVAGPVERQRENSESRGVAHLAVGLK